MKFKIYSSSAGSGKTYTLTKEYLKLVLQEENPYYFRHILAITFTNDAANEMKARILKALANFTFFESLQENKQQEAQQLLSAISQEIEIDIEVLKARASQVFQKIIYNYADFSISTIDSFVNSVINAFTKELEIPHNYEVSLDTEQLMKVTIQRVLEKVGEDGKEDLSKIVVSWAIDKINAGKSWSRINSELVEFAKRDLTNERSYKYVQKLAHLTLEDFTKLNQQLRSYVESIETEIQNIAQEAAQLIRQAGIAIDDFYRKKQGVGNYIEKISTGEDLFKPANSYVQSALKEDIWYSKKNKNDQIDAIAPQLKQFLLDIDATRSKHQLKYQLAKLILSNIYKVSLIQEIENELQEVKQEMNAIHISDTNKKIAKIVAHEPIPFIYERIGERYHHILIDEFQDTSVMQWLNLLPLIENNLSEAKFNLVVGDAKQAIYRWRGGEMEQLVYLYQNKVKSLVDFGEEGLPFLEDRYNFISQYQQPEQLRYNYRSSQEIIEFNNHFFRILVEQSLVHQYPLIPAIYDEYFEQQIPEANQKKGGHVEISFVEKGETYTENTLNRLLIAINQAVESGFSWGDIAILCRKNKHAQEVANFLEEQQIAIISQDSLLLKSDEKVSFLIAIIKVIAFPEDKLIKSEALYLFYKAIKKEIPDEETNEAIKETVNSHVFDFFEKIISEGYPVDYLQLQQLGVYELVEKLIAQFKLLEQKNNLEYIFQFLDVVLAFSFQNASSVGEFLSHWAEKKDSLSINLPKGKDAITVTSIHKSKGLEYPVVLIPFVDWNFTQADNIWVSFEESNLEEVTHSALPTSLVAANQSLQATIFKEQYEQEMEKKFIENFNLLYVAFTRPVYRLHIIAKNPGDSVNKPIRNANQLIARYLMYSERLTEGTPAENYVIAEGKIYSKKEKGTNISDTFLIEEAISVDIHHKFHSSLS